MDAVVLHSDIARLVLGYLKRQNLERTSRSFCKTSPHLKQEFTAYQKGFTPHSFCPDLEDIICEYVNITRTVDRILGSLPKSLRLHLFEHKLCEKVKFLLERALESYLQTEPTETDAAVKKTETNQSSNASTSLHSDKENTAKKQNKQKRRRSSLQYSSDERKTPAPLGSKPAKRQRFLEPFCYLSLKKAYAKRRQKSFLQTSSTGEEQTQTDEEYEDVSTNEEENEVEDVQLDDTSLSMMEKPTKESTPHNKAGKGKRGPSLPELSQAILDNPQFQMKLVDNINLALSNSTSNEAQLVLCKNQKTNISAEVVNLATTTNALTEEQQIINSNEMLDQMVKDILKATEKDPTFDAIIENVVGATTQTSNVSAGVQCNIESNAVSSILSMPTTSSVMAAQQQQQQPQQFALLQQPHQQLQQHLTTIPTLSTVSHQIVDTAPTSNVPRTPLIIRTAVAAGSSSLNVAGGEAQMLSTLNANTSFGSLIDPNFSISKLIVLNPNESAQKQHPSVADQSIGNSTADHIINQLTGIEGSTTDEQVYFDANTGQLTIPLFLTDEGLLTNFPFLVNNEAVTQQLQPDNICNMDGSHIEIPLPEPIIVSADQLPPNSIIVKSAQKAFVTEDQRLPNAQPPGTECKKLKNALAPTSLNVRLNTDRETPSTSGIQNTKGYRSLSTPRKRTSHVRTLSFSPKADGSGQTVLAGATPLSTRRCGAQRRTTGSTIMQENNILNAADIPVKPIIKNVEILPRLGAASTSTFATKASSIDVSANESSNSCSVPPLFVNEESSNQTIIKNELSLKESQNISLTDKSSQDVSYKKTDTKRLAAISSDHVDTPKRKQVRRTAVRACKRQLSKSSDEGDKKLKVNESENEEATKNTMSKAKSDASDTKLQDDKMMDEWLRLRNASTSDLDSRLRQLNAANTIVIPRTTRRKKDTPIKKRRTRRKKPLKTKKKMTPENLDDAAAELEQESDRDTSGDALAVEDKDLAGDTECEHKSKSQGRKAIAKTAKGKDKKRRIVNREFNIKIPTPQKDKRESAMKMRSERTPHISPELPVNSSNDDVDKSIPFQIPTNRAEINIKAPAINEERLEQERDRRTANIACLLETPFKTPTTLGDIPPTPGIPLLDTPATKLDASTSKELHSTSYLFGSLTKSELETPQLSAITPGLRFTPFSSSRDVTPRSTGPATDYSSGGSYYKPDESDDLDRNFDKLLKDSAQKRKEEEESSGTNIHGGAEKTEEMGRGTNPNVEQKAGAICVEIPAEKLRVEPIVLKRVKSFGAEGADNEEGSTSAANINPHYTLVSELPEICVEDESSNSSRTSSSSSSSSSSDSSSTSSNSSIHSGGAASHEEGEISSSGLENLHKTPDKLRLSLDNLSTISSTEDEEWQKLAVTEEENSQLVSNDGEVRYPVRSWLTPNKVDKEDDEMHETACATTIKVTVPLKSAEKRNRLEDDLQQKRERMMDKLKHDANQGRDKHTSIPATPPTGMTAALSAKRKLAAMREKAAKSHHQSAKTSMHATTSTGTMLEVKEERTHEVLTALQLSAKKTVTQQMSAAGGSNPKAPPLSACDDNAVSTLFSAQTSTTTYELTEKAERLPLKTLLSKVKGKPRKCLQIEPLPVLKTSRASSVGRKKIVRNPLGFKGKIKTPAVVEELEEVKSPLKVVTKNAAECRKQVEEKSDSEANSPKVSPVPRIKIKSSSGSNAPSCSKQRVSPRLRLTKEAEAKSGDGSEAATGTKQQTKKTTKTVKSSTGASKRLLTARAKVEAAKKKAQERRLALVSSIAEPTKEGERPKQGDNAGNDQSTKSTTVKVGKEKTQKKNEPKEEQQTHKVQKNTKATAYTTTSDGKLHKAEEQKKLKDNPVAKEVAEKMYASTTNMVKSSPEKKEQVEERIEHTDTYPSKDIPISTTAMAATHTKGTNVEAKLQMKETQKEPKITGESAREDSTNMPAKSPEESKSEIKKEQKDNSNQSDNPSTSTERLATPTSTTNVEPAPTEISEDDPMDGCELTTVTEEDPVRFFCVSYNGPDTAPANPLPRRDFSNFKMVVAFDENEKHIWRISDEFVLYNTSPSTQQIRNIPKKRKVRIDTCGNDEDNVATVGVVHSTTTMAAATTTLPSSTLKTTAAEATATGTNNNNSSSQDKPVATSTPGDGEASSSTQDEKKQRSKQATNSAATHGEVIASTSTAATPNATTEVLRMDDIESLLSHLHGTEK